MSTLSETERTRSGPASEIVHACDTPDSTTAKCGADVTGRSVKPNGTYPDCAVCSYLVAGWPQ